jgi:hypothetical protein
MRVLVFALLASTVLLSSAARISVAKCRDRCTNLEQGSKCSSDCSPTPRAVKRTPTPNPSPCPPYGGFANTKGCGCVKICNGGCGFWQTSTTLGAVYTIDHLMVQVSGSTENYPQPLTFVFSWEIWQNHSGRTSKVKLPLMLTIQETTDDNLGPRTSIIVKTDVCLVKSNYLTCRLYFIQYLNM